MAKIGIIGTGHMGAALLKGLLRSGFATPSITWLSGGTSGNTQRLATQLQCQFVASNAFTALNAEILILAVVPQIMPQVLGEIREHVSPETLVISVASSFTLTALQQILPAGKGIVRAIPNMPVAIGAGVTAMSATAQTSDEGRSLAQHLFEAVGKTVWVDESKLEIASTVSGCSPAFVAMFIEALADAGVYYGLSRNEAYLLCEQATMGAAQMLLQEQLLPAALKDSVASPGGTTIAGITALEQFGLRNAVIQAVKAIGGERHKS